MQGITIKSHLPLIRAPGAVAPAQNWQKSHKEKNRVMGEKMDIFGSTSLPPKSFHGVLNS